MLALVVRAGDCRLLSGVSGGSGSRLLKAARSPWLLIAWLPDRVVTRFARGTQRRPEWRSQSSHTNEVSAVKHLPFIRSRWGVRERLTQRAGERTEQASDPDDCILRSHLHKTGALLDREFEWQTFSVSSA